MLSICNSKELQFGTDKYATDKLLINSPLIISFAEKSVELTR